MICCRQNQKRNSVAQFRAALNKHHVGNIFTVETRHHDIFSYAISRRPDSALVLPARTAKTRARRPRTSAATQRSRHAPRLRYRKMTRRGAVWFVEAMFPDISSCTLSIPISIGASHILRAFKGSINLAMISPARHAGLITSLQRNE